MARDAEVINQIFGFFFHASFNILEIELRWFLKGGRWNKNIKGVIINFI